MVWAAPFKGGFLGLMVNYLKAVAAITFSVKQGETVSLVSESGCGKSTAGMATRALLSAIPAQKQGKKTKRIILSGDVTSSIDPPEDCRFHNRCSYARDRCRIEVPELISTANMKDGHLVACHFFEEIEPEQVF